MKKTGKTTGWMVLLVFCLFALCLLQTLLTGAGVYKRLVDQGEAQHQARTAVQYVATRVRQAHTVAVEDFGGCPGLALGETIEGDAYVTRVYCYEGWLRELFCLRSGDFTPGDGEKVLPADALELSLKDGLLTVNIDSKTLMLHIPAGKEAPDEE